MRHVYFSFHFRNDIFRANVVRNTWVGKGGSQAAGYKDLSMWESARTRDDRRLTGMIRDALRGTSVTVVLIGTDTADRYWVRHAILESWVKGNGLLGIHIHDIADMRTGNTARKGANPFRGIRVEDEDGRNVDLHDEIEIYDWWRDDGNHNFADWIERAARQAGR